MKFSELVKLLEHNGLMIDLEYSLIIEATSIAA